MVDPIKWPRPAEEIRGKISGLKGKCPPHILLKEGCSNDDTFVLGAVIQPLPTSYLIFRAASQAAGKCWMDALELSLRCSALLIRSVSNNLTPGDVPDVGTTAIDTQWSEADYEKHFNDHGKYI